MGSMLWDGEAKDTPKQVLLLFIELLILCSVLLLSFMLLFMLSFILSSKATPAAVAAAAPAVVVVFFSNPNSKVSLRTAQASHVTNASMELEPFE